MSRSSAVLLCVCMALAACGHKKDDAGGGARTAVPATPLEGYKKQLGPLVEAESAALAAVAGKTGANYTDDATLLAALHDVALPKYRNFVAGLEKIAPPPETAKLHERLLAAARAEKVLLEKSEQALARGDGTAIFVGINQEQRKVRAELDGVLADYDALVASVKPASTTAQK